MSRIIIFGNSQAGALKAAWEEIGSRHPGVEIDFFALPYPHSQRIQIRKDGRLALRPSESGAKDQKDRAAEIAMRLFGRTELDLATADMVVWVGYPFPATKLAKILASSDVDGIYTLGRDTLISGPAFRAFLESFAAEILPAPIWRERLADRLVVMLQQNYSEICLNLPRSKKIAPWQRLAQSGIDTLPAFSALAEAVTHTFGLHGIRVEPQPAETLAPSGLTLERWTKGSRRIVNNKDHPEIDFYHANTAYGALCLDRLIARLDTTVKSGAPQPEGSVSMHAQT